MRRHAPAEKLGGTAVRREISNENQSQKLIDTSRAANSGHGDMNGFAAFFCAAKKDAGIPFICAFGLNGLLFFPDKAGRFLVLP